MENQATPTSNEHHTSYLSFQDSHILAALLGPQDKTLRTLEQELMVKSGCRGNVISLAGNETLVHAAESALKTIYHKLKHKVDLSEGDILAIIKSAKQAEAEQMDMYEGNLKVNEKSDGKEGGQSDGKAIRNIAKQVIKTHNKPISPHSKRQHEYVNALFEKDVVFASGPAGTGKTYLSVAVAASMFLQGHVDRILLCRPAVEAGESLGFLPGDMRDKVDPYMRPLYDSLFDMMPEDKVQKYLDSGKIEIAPLAYMRGRTLKNAFIILDEAQNATKIQMKMFLTRLGEGSHMAINGDLSQTDLPKNVSSGFDDALRRLNNIDGIGMVKFDAMDIVRHPLTSKIIEAYEKDDK